jgi:hypothetical protein
MNTIYLLGFCIEKPLHANRLANQHSFFRNSTETMLSHKLTEKGGGKNRKK